MEDSGVLIRNAQPGDWSKFHKIDEKCFGSTGIDVITKKQFNAWLKVFPEGFFVIEQLGEIKGYIYFQVCDFNPEDISDNRSFNEITDFGYTLKSHDIKSFCLYVVSVASISSGLGRSLIKKGYYFTNELNKKYYAGACRIPSFLKYVRKNNKEPSKEVIDKYVKMVTDTVKKRNSSEIKYFDPAISTILRTEEIDYYRNIENFLPDKASCNWAAVVGCRL